jgi:hypothetical protein
MARLYEIVATSIATGIVFLFLTTSHAHAALGERASPSQSGPYTVRESAVGGVKIREYAAPDGTIFAITWRGLGHPDLTPFLGSYYAEYEAMNRNAAAGRKKRTNRLAHSSVSTQHVVVRKFGHLRSARGLAYVPALLPKGVEPGELQ